MKNIWGLGKQENWSWLYKRSAMRLGKAGISKGGLIEVTKRGGKQEKARNSGKGSRIIG